MMTFSEEFVIVELHLVIVAAQLSAVQCAVTVRVDRKFHVERPQVSAAHNDIAEIVRQGDEGLLDGGVSVATVTFFLGVAPIAALKERVGEMLVATP